MLGGPFLWTQLDPTRSETKQQQGSSHTKHATPRRFQEPTELLALRLVIYLTRYSARLATITAPLCQLMKKEVAYTWGPEHELAFSAVNLLKDLGPVLLQNGQPVCYASKTFTETEQKYSNIEREALGLVWGLERFQYFIYGKHCTIQTDHKPL